MCGIAGWVDWERDLTQEKETVAAMGETLACRGPDADGAWFSTRAAFAHRRLTVVDPVGGAQPMVRTHGDRTYSITYNGELYNTEDIRSKLALLGYQFESYSDTEVLLISYIEWGSECVHQLNGIFAFAIWDEKNDSLFMARDRLGVKPLFYSQTGTGVLFGSELKAILANPQIEPVIDEEGLAEIFCVGPARTPGHGVFKGIDELRPGHRMTVTKSTTKIDQYWSLKAEEHTDNLETTVEKVKELFLDTVSRQLVSDVPVCTFLSGGLDSSAVSAVAAEAFEEQGMGRLHTYSIDFDGMEQNFEANAFQTGLDAPWARKVSNHIDSMHHPVVFSMKDQLEHLMTPIKARDLPGMYDIDSSLYLFCKEIKKDATVALSGEAADEVFGGYPWFHRQESLDADTFPWALKLQERVNVLSPDIQDKIKPYEYVQKRYQEALAEVPRLEGESEREARIREISYLSITRFLATLLDRKDRMSMATGLEVRVPFCDHRLVQYVFNIPWEYKACDNQVKGVFRRAMKAYLPKDVLGRKKSPYPSDPNPEYLQAVRSRLEEILADDKAPIRPLLDEGAVKEWISSSYDKSEHRPWFGQIAGTAQMFHYLIQVNQWLKDYKVRIEFSRKTALQEN
ncbi:asparagine synthase (glutamine-hydrolyzing) [Alicyclobacillus sp. SO9]|uniref:asparagine synthase (glutamine-hydrolyzing) n=1 Tax=Alicyclobacillus sp. SO9 TaxID=2665646 RepID=UPI0018E772FA|nr:asparagine synthase (glutamine-hydrolyzing) [Alicyclobacillus sp. SO9]QQE79372.1 asparagine synthase (glutamine-hydrolyzing) [Alicyclobacillus sp. SO9]